jgi:hypothetical protein
MRLITFFLQMLLVGFLIAAGLAGIISLIGWLAGWATARQYSDGLFLSGSVVIVAGIIAIVGGFTARTDFGMLYGQSAGNMSGFERTRGMMMEMIRGYRVLAMATIIGAALILISIVTYQLFG